MNDTKNRNKKTMNLRIRDILRDSIPYQAWIKYNKKNEPILDENEKQFFREFEKNFYS